LTAKREFFSTNEIAQILGISPFTIRRYIQLRKLKAVKLEGSYRVRRTDLDAFVEAREIETEEELAALDEPTSREDAPVARKPVAAKETPVARKSVAPKEPVSPRTKRVAPDEPATPRATHLSPVETPRRTSRKPATPAPAHAKRSKDS